MRYVLMLFLAAGLHAAASDGQPASSDSQMNLAMLREVRQLRQDLQALAGTIPRLAIVMYRHQTQAASLDRAQQRLEYAALSLPNKIPLADQ